MRIERKFETAANEEIAAYQKETMMENAKKTPAELKADELELKSSFERMMAKIALKEKYSHRVLNPTKWKAFERFYQAAIKMAEDTQSNILIESDEESKATITISNRTLVFQKEYTNPVTSVFCDLMSHAKECWIHSKDGGIEIIFWFEICDEFIRTDLYNKELQ